MSISNRSSAEQATAAAATSAASGRRPANRPTPERRRFTLTSRSEAIDHSRNAARRDLADIALAGLWFAPHYAVPQSRICGPDSADLRSAPDDRTDSLGRLAAGDAFAVLELGQYWTWGYREADRLVGYVPTRALNSGNDAQ